MAPGKWDDEEGSDTSSSEESSPAPVVARRGKFDDEEDDDDVPETWTDEEDSDEERERLKKEAEAKAKAEAEAKANHLTKAQRIEKRREENLKKKLEDEDEDDSDDESPEERKLRLRQEEKEADLKNARDLFGGADDRIARRSAAVNPVVVAEDGDPTNAIDLSAMPLFSPKTKDQFNRLKDTLVPLLTAASKNPQYTIFLQDFAKQLVKDLPSDQTRKIGTAITTASNEKMKEEKAAEKGGKKSKAAKTKTSLVASRDVAVKADTAAYDDDFGDDDFM